MKTRRMTTVGGGALAALLLVWGAAWAAGTAGTAGTADPTFGTNGVLVGSGGTVYATAVQGDGRIVAVGSEPSGVFVDGNETSQWFVQRCLGNGAADTSFGGNGVVTFFAEGDWNERAIDVAIDGTGRIVVAGRGSQEVTSGKGRKQTTRWIPSATVLRLEADGDLDPDFGIGGVVFLEGLTFLEDLELQDDGSMVVSSEAEMAASGGKKKKGGGGGNLTTGLYLAKLTAAGTLDGTFGDGGVVQHNLVSETFLSDERTMFHGLAVQSDGSVLLGAWTRPNSDREYWRLVRFTATGAFDETFPTINESGLILEGVTTDDSDRILCAGVERSTDDVVVIRYLASGARDTTFGSGGMTAISPSPRIQVNGGVLQDGTRIYVGGNRFVDGQLEVTAAVVLAFELDGDLDPTFGTSGFSDALTTAEGAGMLDLELTPFGDLVIGGTTLVYPEDRVLGRLCGN